MSDNFCPVCERYYNTAHKCNKRRLYDKDGVVPDAIDWTIEGRNLHAENSQLQAQLKIAVEALGKYARYPDPHISLEENGIGELLFVQKANDEQSFPLAKQALEQIAQLDKKKEGAVK